MDYVLTIHFPSGLVETRHCITALEALGMISYVNERRAATGFFPARFNLKRG